MEVELAPIAIGLVIILKKDKFKQLSQYLHEKNYYTMTDVVSELVIPKQGIDEFLIHDEIKDNLLERHKSFLEKMKLKNEQNQNFSFFYNIVIFILE